MRRPQVTIVPTGTANTASVVAALERAGAAPAFAGSASDVADAPYVVLPGVGAFGAAMRRLEERDLVDAMRERVALDRPTLGVCLGLQLLGDSSEESPGIAGIGALRMESARFGGELAVPQIGWNQVAADAG